MRLPPTDLPTLLQKLWDERYTGQTLLHWLDGVPREVEVLDRRRFYLTGKPSEPTLKAAHAPAAQGGGS